MGEVEVSGNTSSREPRMRQAYEYVQRNPGCTKYEVQRAVGPHGSLFYGWRTLNRAIAAGLILAVPHGTRFMLRAVSQETLDLIK